MINKYLIILILTLLILSSCGRTHKLDYFENGKIRSDLYYSGDKLDGECKFYFESGQLQSVFNYQKGILHGVSLQYFYNGKVQTEEFYIDGKLNNTLKLYYETGNLKDVYNYTNDTLDGLYYSYFPKSEIRIEGNYNFGQYDSLWNYYDKYGRIVGEAEFINGTGELKSYFPNGNIQRITPYIKSEKSGTEKHFNKSGELLKQIEFK